MAYRQIHTHIWKDEWFLDLDPAEKLLFVYLFSNDNTTLAGIYKISLKVIAFETGLELPFIKNTLDKFNKAGKAIYQDGIIWVVNMMHYNASSESPKVKACIIKELGNIPDCELKTRYLTGNIGYQYHIDTPSLINNNNNNNNNTTETETEQDQELDAATAAVSTEYEKNIGMITPMIADEIRELVTIYSQETIVDAFTEAVNNNVRKMSYISAILKNWKTNGRTDKTLKRGEKGKQPTDPKDYKAGEFAEYIN